MLNETKRDLTLCARKLAKPYEKYTIDELADAYCEALDSNNTVLMNNYYSALMLRFWYQIPKLYKDLCQYKDVDYERCYDGVNDSIRQACEPTNRKWQTSSVSAEQVINQIISTRVRAAIIYEANLQKNAGKHLEVSLDAPICGDSDDAAKTIADTIEMEDPVYDHSSDNVISLVQDYINSNRIVEAILLDNIAFNDVQRHFKRVVKTTNSAGEAIKYTEHSSEFWPYKLVQIVSQLPATYKRTFMNRYNISEEKLTSVLEAIDKSNNQKLYRYLDNCLNELRASYV